MRYQAVLLIAYGGPQRMEDVRPYLANVFRGRPVPVHRVEEVVHHYARFGGRSPLTELTVRQAAALESQLRERDLLLPVHVGMRNWTPYLHEALGRLQRQGVRRVLGVIMAPHQCYASWEQYRDNVEEARRQVGEEAPEVDYLEPWWDRAGFVEAQADRAAEELAALPEEWRRSTPLVFTAHSIPVRMAEESPYVQQVETTARLVAHRLGHDLWRVAFQSRSGDPREPWLEPDVSAVLREVAAAGAHAAVVVPVGFVCDHIEVLYDLDVEARAAAEGSGLVFRRAKTVMDHPAFIGMLADMVQARAGG